VKISIETHEAGAGLSKRDRRGVQDLFTAAYYHYHYRATRQQVDDLLGVLVDGAAVYQVGGRSRRGGAGNSSVRSGLGFRVRLHAAQWSTDSMY